MTAEKKQSRREFLGKSTVLIGGIAVPHGVIAEEAAVPLSSLTEQENEISCGVSSSSEIREKIAICLSGGGYRAMLFHLGSVWRLFETGLLSECDRISSVSGGSITAGVLGLNWSKLDFTNIESYQKEVVAPIRKLASKTIDVPSGIKGLLFPGKISDKIRKSYDRILFHGADLQQLPDSPRFIFNATNVQTGAVFRFSKPYIADYRVGRIHNPTVSISRAVAASSAFPPFLSPSVLYTNDDNQFVEERGNDLHMPPYTEKVILTDGGVYDNLGLEPAFKSYRTLLVSDAGGKTGPDPDPNADWARHAYRVLNLIDNQVRSLRKRELIGAYIAKERKGMYWGTRTDISCATTEVMPFSPELARALALEPTRLKKLPEKKQEDLINWGYVSCDSQLRQHCDISLPDYVDTLIPLPEKLPYPA